LSASEKPALRPNTGNRLRLRGKTARQRFIEADVTPDQHRQILEHCLRNKISVSEFLSELILQDAAAHKSRKGRRVSTEVGLSEVEYAKLELLVYLHGKESVSDLIRELLQPHLDLQRFHVPTETKTVRLYLSDQEHELATQHIARRGITARKYVSFLALKELAVLNKKPK
jgi:hypothetical protein